MSQLYFKMKKISGSSFLNGSRYLIKSASNGPKKRKFSGLISHNNSKCHSRNSSCTKKKKSKSKSKLKNKNNNIVDKMLFLQYDTKICKKSRAVKILPEAIKFKQKDHLRGSKILSKTQKLKTKQTIYDENKENEMSQNNKHHDKFLSNKQLLKSTLKPNKMNYMSKVSNVYDLVISRVMLPPFIQYFLGEALYVINKESKMSGSLDGNAIYDWRLDQFKRISQKIYENSEQQDLKHFMGLSLPTISRWNSKINSTKNAASIPANTLITTHEDSRISNGLSSASYNNNHRVGYFRSLNKRDRISLGQQKQSIDIIDKLNNKLDNYLKSHCNKIQPNSQKPSIFELPLKYQNKVSFNFSQYT